MVYGCHIAQPLFVNVDSWIPPQRSTILLSSSLITVFALQPWQTPTNKLWPGSARADEIHGDRNVVATLYDKLVASKKAKK